MLMSHNSNTIFAVRFIADIIVLVVHTKHRRSGQSIRLHVIPSTSRLHVKKDMFALSFIISIAILLPDTKGEVP